MASTFAGDLVARAPYPPSTRPHSLRIEGRLCSGVEPRATELGSVTTLAIRRRRIGGRGLVNGRRCAGRCIAMLCRSESRAAAIRREGARCVAFT